MKLLTFIFLLILNYSCIDKRKNEKDVYKTDLKVKAQKDSLKFTSGIRVIFQDSKGNFWLGSHSEGLCCYDGQIFNYYTTFNGLYDNNIRSIQEDKDGIIWIGTSSGVISLNDGKIKRYSTDFNNPKLDWTETKGSLWFYAGEEDGISRFDGERMNYLIFPKPKNDQMNKSYGVTDISKDKKGKVWIATYSALYSYDSDTLNVFDHKKLNLNEDEKLHIRSVLADSKGRIWIGNNGIGVVLIKGDSIRYFSKEYGKLIPMDEFEENIKTKQFAKNTGLQSVFAIEEDAEGNIWFGDRNSGAWKYDGTSLTNYSFDNKHGTQMIWSIYKDKYNNVLFGLADGGVYRFNGKSFDKIF